MFAVLFNGICDLADCGIKNGVSYGRGVFGVVDFVDFRHRARGVGGAREKSSEFACGRRARNAGF